MMFNGAGFPSFVSNFAQLNHLAYLSDVARLELALRSAYHAADITQIHSSELEALAPDKLSKAYIELALAVRLIRSPWPILAIWCYNMRDGAPKPPPQAQDVLVVLANFDPAALLLSPGGAVLSIVCKIKIGSAMHLSTHSASVLHLIFQAFCQCCLLAMR